jgi:hypothetical protein
MSSIVNEIDKYHKEPKNDNSSDIGILSSISQNPKIE